MCVLIIIFFKYNYTYVYIGKGYFLKVGASSNASVTDVILQHIFMCHATPQTSVYKIML